MLDLHADPATIFALREASRSDDDLATLHAAGAAFTAPGGHPTQFGGDISNTVTSEEEVGARFAALLPLQPDAIKAVVEHGHWGGLPAMPTLDLELLSAVGAQAREAKLPLLCHVWTLDEAKTAVAAHARALAHGVFLGEVDDALIDAMKREGTAYVPTLAVVFGGARSVAGARPYGGALVAQVLHPAIVEALNDTAQIASLAASPMVDVLKDGGEARCLSNLKRLADAGIPIGLGTDAGNPFTPHGPSALFELQLYVEAGLSPAQALTAAAPGAPDASGAPGAPAAPGASDAPGASGAPGAPGASGAPGVLGRWSGAWEAYADSMAPGGKSSCSVAWLDDAEGGRLRVQGSLEQGFAWGAFAGVAVLWDGERKLLADASASTGLRLRLRGTPRDGNLSVQCAAVKDLNVFAAPLSVTEEWAVAEVPFQALQQIGYGKPVTWTGADITGLNLEARNSPFSPPAYGPFHIEVDWIEFY